METSNVQDTHDDGSQLFEPETTGSSEELSVDDIISLLVTLIFSAELDWIKLIASFIQAIVKVGFLDPVLSIISRTVIIKDQLLQTPYIP